MNFDADQCWGLNATQNDDDDDGDDENEEDKSLSTMWYGVDCIYLRLIFSSKITESKIFEAKWISLFR